MLGRQATIQTRCPVSGEPLHLEVGVGGPEPGTRSVVHFALPAARWWNNIGFT